MTRRTKSNRIPVGGNKDILTVKGKNDNYVYRWVNDTDNRIQTFLEAGYDFEQSDVAVGTKDVNQEVGKGSTVTKAVGKNTTAYLMKIPKEWYEEDQAAKQRDRVDRAEEMIHEHANKVSGRYGEIKVK